jgi:ribosomal protein S16
MTSSDENEYKMNRLAIHTAFKILHRIVTDETRSARETGYMEEIGRYIDASNEIPHEY